MAVVGKAIYVIGGDNSQFKKDVSSTRHIASSAGKAIAGAFAAGTAAVGALTAAVIKGRGEQEQLVGGIETLFGDSAERLRQYADDAYQTAQISANNYMEQATSFAASLVNSVGGDTEKAVDMADMAIKDMSDNANKMGSSIESIQNAYQGFAKSNFTLLDNLKLGKQTPLLSI